MSLLKKMTALLAVAALLCTSLVIADQPQETPTLTPTVADAPVTVLPSVPVIGNAVSDSQFVRPLEAEPLAVTPDEEVDLETDTDEDGIADVIEELLGSDADNADSDNDGISDYDETVKLGTDPTLSDSDRNGIVDGEEDTDHDGIANNDEQALGTDMVQGDSDGDGIADGDETATDPLVPDTDADGVKDGYELELGTDPVTPESTFDVSQSVAVDDLTVAVDVTLSGEQVDTLAVAPTTNTKLFPNDIPGYMGQAVDLTVDGEFEGATLTFSYPLEKGYVEPTLYYFSEATQTLEMVEATVENGTVLATVNEAATYILLDRTVYEGSLTWDDVWGVSELYGAVEVVLVMDDSASLKETDPENYRLTVAKNLITGLPAVSKVGLVRFSTIMNVLTEQLTDRETASSYLTEEYFLSDGGTEMYTAVETALTLFESENATTERVMIVLSDGVSLDTFRYDTIVQEMTDRGIALHMIDLDTDAHWFNLTPERFAADVNGSYYYAEQISVLEDICATIGKTIDLTVDSDGDTIPDYYEDNMIAFNGTRIPLDKQSADTDGDGVADNEEVSVSLVYSEDGTMVYVKGMLLSDPLLSDGDGDGTPDGEDAHPLDNTFIATMTTEYASRSNLSFVMDYGWFGQDNTVYIPELSKLSSVMSAVIYEPSSINVSDTNRTRTATADTCAELLTYFGMQDAQMYSLSTDYTDNHLSEVAIGYRNVVVNGETKTVLAVIVRGTNATIEEWSSNCDIGNLLADTENDDWVNTDNHKGFDVAATRILRFMERYIDEHGLDRDTLLYWVTGHSRGAAIADIIGANLEKAGNTAFTYAFATPNNTLAADAASYNSVFNIINKEDFVPKMPMVEWGYRCYGRYTANTSIWDSYETEWESLTGIFDYNPSSSVDSGAQTIAGIITSGADPRIDSYRYTCTCHGDGSNHTITIKNTGMSESSREKAIAKIPQNALSSCVITRYDGGWLGGWDFEVCQTPSYFMQLLAAFMGKEIDAYRFAVELAIAKRYESAKNALINVGITGVEHAHYPESYYVLASHITAADFTS